MTLQSLTPVNCASLLQPGCSLLQLDGQVLLFGQKGWPKRSCPTGVFGIHFKQSNMRLRAISFSNDSSYIPPLRCPAVCRLDPYDGLPESYLIHGGRTPNNEISSSLYLLTTDSRGSNRKLTICCKEKELVGTVPAARYGHTVSMVQSHGKTACVLFGGRSYRPAGERTTESWNSVVDCPPQVFLFDLEFGCSTAYTLPELSEGQSFHVALTREDCVYFIGGHSLTSDSRPPRLFRLRVELLQGSPLLSCESLDIGISISSAIITRVGPTHKYIILGGYQSDSEKRMKCTTVVLDEKGIQFETLEAPKWTPDITHSRTWFGGCAGEGKVLLAVPTEGRQPQTDMHYFYLVSFQTEGERKEEEGTQGCSQESTDYDDSPPLEDSEELYFGREPHELDDSSEGDNYNEEDEEDESQTGYWMKCCLGCQVEPNKWEPYYSTELYRPAMIFCSRGEGGHWVHAQCMELTETLLVSLSQGRKKYFCLDHGGLPYQETTPTRQVTPLKRTPIKVKNRKTPPVIKISPAKKSFFRRLFE
ncbi:V(D)J recombination-activating protein 2 [Solea solea]|uniref:V(D)J recombination-activating protein 2 n=1 Tax=Solea solea TaxID=90069 RepID=UPI002729EA59|nr:V(D)J recombination-activating protein 2 [Solea solea]XP_058500330.1 V(D)J recombination-activating protein 2 [Solea solea]